MPAQSPSRIFCMVPIPLSSAVGSPRAAVPFSFSCSKGRQKPGKAEEKLGVETQTETLSPGSRTHHTVNGNHRCLTPDDHVERHENQDLDRHGDGTAATPSNILSFETNMRAQMPLQSTRHTLVDTEQPVLAVLWLSGPRAFPTAELEVMCDKTYARPQGIRSLHAPRRFTIRSLSM